MSKGPRYKVPFRRRRMGITDYHQRRRLLMGRVPRLVVRKSLKKVNVQIVDYVAEGDVIVASALSSELKKFGWTGNFRNIPAAYFAGYIAGKRGVKAGITEAVLDIGLAKPVPGSIPFAVIKGALDAGLSIPVGKGAIPSDERISGEHLSEATKEEFEKVKETLKEADL